MMISFESRDSRRGFQQKGLPAVDALHVSQWPQTVFSSFILIFPANYRSSTYDTNFPTFWNLDAVIASDPPRDVLSP